MHVKTGRFEMPLHNDVFDIIRLLAEIKLLPTERLHEFVVLLDRELAGFDEELGEKGVGDDGAPGDRVRYRM